MASTAPNPPTRITDMNDLFTFAEWLRVAAGGDAVWFRGQPDSSWSLTCRLDRAPQSLRAVEQRLMDEFYSKAGPMMERHLTRFDYTGRLTVARHYGLPCRLLDWSESVLTAAYFAVSATGCNCCCQRCSSASHEPGEARLFGLLPQELNGWWDSVMYRDREISFTGIRGDDGLGSARLLDEGAWIPLLHSAHLHVGRIVTGAFHDSRKRDERVLGVHAPVIDSRMARQLAAFTIHGTDTPLDTLGQGKHWLVSAVMPAESHPAIREGLRDAGIRGSTLFPDLDHLAVDIELAVREQVATTSGG